MLPNTTPIEKLSLTDLQYNPELGGFEAKAKLFSRDQAFTYPVRIPATPHMSFDSVMRGLAERATAAHRHAPSRIGSLQRTPNRQIISALAA